MGSVATSAEVTHGSDVCPFCDDFILTSNSPFDRVLYESAAVRIIPALGMLVPGYFIATTQSHILSTAELPIAERRHLQAEVLNFISGVLSDLFGPYLIFEHGSCDTSGSCVSHAHMHLIPSTLRLEWSLLSRLPWRALTSMDELYTFAGREYAYLGNATENYVYDAGRLPSQWVRQVLAQTTGATSWDWALDSGADNLSETLSRLSVSQQLTERGVACA